MPACDTWVNIRDLGAKGDGHTDDTAALQNAIANHRAIYFPSGFYLVHDTLELRADTVLIGLHPAATQIILPDNTPAFAGTGTPKALLEAPQGGSNIVIGIGLYTSGNNPRAPSRRHFPESRRTKFDDERCPFSRRPRDSAARRFA